MKSLVIALPLVLISFSEMKIEQLNNVLANELTETIDKKISLRF